MAVEARVPCTAAGLCPLGRAAEGCLAQSQEGSPTASRQSGPSRMMFRQTPGWEPGSTGLRKWDRRATCLPVSAALSVDVGSGSEDNLLSTFITLDHFWLWSWIR